MKLKNTELLDNFNLMTDLQKSDWKFLSKFIFEEVGLSLNVKNLKIKGIEGCWGGLQCKQYPDELAKLLVYLFNNKNIINSYCEIGCEKGGTFFIIDSFLRSINPNFKNSLAIDISGSILRHNFQDYSNKFSTVNFIKLNSKDFNPSQYFDLCLIDGDHSYDGVKNDFNKMKDYSRIIAFHDIKCPLFDVKKFWKEIGGEIEFLNEDNRFPIQLGIGIYY